MRSSIGCRVQTEKGYYISPNLHGSLIQIRLKLEFALASDAALESGRAADKSGPLGTIDPAAT